MEGESLSVPAPWGKAFPLAQARALLEAGRDVEAEALLEAWRGEGPPEAERLALLGFARARRGDLLGYRRLALEAARQTQTPLTLYHLGLSLPPREGVVALEEAWHRLDGEEARARLAFALARVKRKLGRLREALAWASLAVLESPQHPYYRLEELALLALAGEEPLEALGEALPPFFGHQAQGVRVYTLWLHLLLEGARGRVDGEALLALARQVRPHSLPYLLPFLLLLREASPGEKELPRRLLRAAQAAAPQEPLSQALLRLAEGLLLYPRPEALSLLEEALPPLQEDLAEEALRAEAQLAALQGRPLCPRLGDLAGELRPEVRLLFLPEELPPPEAPYLRVLGRAEAQGLTPLRPRGLEVLVLLLAHPEGLAPERLAREVYGEANLEALRTEISRLRPVGLRIASRPYRLKSPLQADFLDVLRELGAGNPKGALLRYRGPLLPKSQAPGIELLRRHLEEALKEGVLGTRNPDLLHALAQRLPEDLEAWEALLEALPPTDPRRPATLAWTQRLRRWYR